MQIRQACSAMDAKSYDSARLRDTFLLDRLMHPGEIHLTYSHFDRVIVGSAHPLQTDLQLTADNSLRSNEFLARREMGIINLGGPGVVACGEQVFELQPLDCLYLGKGSKNPRFSSHNAEHPALFYWVSTTAHRSCDNVHGRRADANPIRLGSQVNGNERTIYQYIHPQGIASCQLVMGMTQLARGSLWNTFPPHTHERRMEVYCYFDLDPQDRVFHLMGEANETRHLVVANHQAVISPPWSLHSGVGTGNYSFVWAMAGENQEFDDMDGIAIEELR